MKRRITTVLTVFGMAALFGAAPIGLHDGGSFLRAKQALATPGNGNGNGNGNGHEHVSAHGASSGKQEQGSRGTGCGCS